MIHRLADIEPLSPGEQKLRQLDKRDMVMRGVAIAILILATSFNMLSGWLLQNLIKQNRQETIKARQTNFERQDQIQAYIKCIVLLRYDHPELKPDSPRQDVNKALDDCSKKQ